MVKALWATQFLSQSLLCCGGAKAAVDITWVESVMVCLQNRWQGGFGLSAIVCWLLSSNNRIMGLPTSLQRECGLAGWPLCSAACRLGWFRGSGLESLRATHPQVCLLSWEHSWAPRSLGTRSMWSLWHGSFRLTKLLIRWLRAPRVCAQRDGSVLPF